MNQAEIMRLLNSIKSDDLALFSTHSKGNENICFGRFPLLTLCYLYQSKKIIKTHKDTLIKIKYYKEVDEPYEIYKKFSAIAKRNLRLYLSENSIVSPIEMLAILGKDRDVKKLYRFYSENRLLNEKISKNLSKIYTISYQKAKTTDKSIRISPKPLTATQKKFYKLSACFAFTFVFLLCSCLMYLNSTVGFGTSFNPYKIYNVNQFYSALSADGYYILCNDLTLDTNPENVNFLGSFDGNGHTLHIKNLPTGGLVACNNGTFQNLNLSYGEFNTSTADSMSLFVDENNGTIDNVGIECKGLTLACNKNSNDIYISGFANKNKGTISNCNLKLESSISTSGSGECFINGIVGINNGTINNCDFVEGSITTADADVVGICTNNERGATILNCDNNASLTQTSALEEWSPNVAGIVHSNYGLIEKCINNGHLTAISNCETSNAQGNILLGGISANNYHVHSYCLNRGNLTAKSKKIVAYCGGITAWASDYEKDSTIVSSAINKNCGTIGDIDVFVEDKESHAFIGGLYGFLRGESSNCFSLSNFITDYEEVAEGQERTHATHLVGSCMGSANTNGLFVDIIISNNYVLNSSKAANQIASLREYVYYNGVVYINLLAGTNLYSGITVTTENQIKQQGVYWYE